jgi:hypothetical protein
MSKQIAAIVTTWFPLSHADVIVGKFLTGFPTDDGLIAPRTQIASLYVDQFSDHDLARRMSEVHRVPIYRSIASALTRGGSELAVDGVLLIGEHGDYAWNERDQHLYPRKYFMEQICGVIAKSGRAVPVYNDKHLSYNWHDARWMYDRARQLGIPFMAGSSVPFGWRSPWMEIEAGTPIHEAVTLGFSGLDIYGFHTLEALQCMVERRAGGETGIAAVTCLEGDAVWESARQGLWSRDLAEAAAAPIANKPEGSMEQNCKDPAVFLLEYRDGLHAAILMLNGYVDQFGFACRADGDVLATEIYLQNSPPHPHFSYLSLSVEEMFLTGQPTYPVERTLLTTGALEAALESRYRGHQRVETPHLDIAYQSYDALPYRPTLPRPRSEGVA